MNSTTFSKLWTKRLFPILKDILKNIFSYHVKVKFALFDSDVYYLQVDLVQTAVFETPWYTFNTSNRKLVIIFLSNLTKQQYLTAGGVFDVNYALLISVSILTQYNLSIPN